MIDATNLNPSVNFRIIFVPGHILHNSSQTSSVKIETIEVDDDESSMPKLVSTARDPTLLPVATPAATPVTTSAATLEPVLQLQTADPKPVNMASVSATVAVPVVATAKTDSKVDDANANTNGEKTSSLKQEQQDVTMALKQGPVQRIPDVKTVQKGFTQDKDSQSPFIEVKSIAVTSLKPSKEQVVAKGRDQAVGPSATHNRLHLFMGYFHDTFASGDSSDVKDIVFLITISLLCLSFMFVAISPISRRYA